MLWYKSWLDTRSRFLIGLVLLMLSAGATVVYYPEVMKLMPMASSIDADGALGRRIREGVELSRDYRGYIWAQWARQAMKNLGTVFAILLGTGGLVSQSSGAGALFMLSMPASRNRVLSVRAATGLAELLALAIVPALLIPVLSPGVGQRYALTDAFAHAVCLFSAAAMFFSLAMLLSTLFTDLWRPLLITCGVAVVLALYEGLVRQVAPYGVFRLMSGETYFRTGHLPWMGLLGSAAASAAMLYAASKSLARQDF